MNHKLHKGENRVIETCKTRNASVYINPIGGVTLYDKKEFEKEGIVLNFIKANEIIYTQFNKPFVPWLSIIDVLMFNPKETIKEYLKSNYYTLQ